MRFLRRHSRALFVVTVLGAGAASLPASGDSPDAGTARSCEGRYANDLTELNARALKRASSDDTHFSYCIRATADYECLSYGADGEVLRSAYHAEAHGTGFGYRIEGTSTLIATNHHVVTWPTVTSEEQPVDDVPRGCKKVGERLRIVDNEDDAFDADDIPLSVVVKSHPLDVAVVRASTPLAVMPWRFGSSAALRERNLVEVRGFPLGQFRAVSIGKVLARADHDTYKRWDHLDFVIDAQLSEGNSGSPVLAVSCLTGEYELVGIFHAGYIRGNSLNVAVAIDQVRELLDTLQAPSTPGDTAAAELQRLVAAASTDQVFAFGRAVALARSRPDGALLFLVFGDDYPTVTTPALVIEVTPAGPAAPGGPARLWVGDAKGLRLLREGALDAAGRTDVDRLAAALQAQALATIDYRAAARTQPRSREELDRIRRQKRRVEAGNNEARPLRRRALELAEALAGRSSGDPVELAEVFAPHPVPAAAAHPDGAPPAQALPAASRTASPVHERP